MAGSIIYFLIGYPGVGKHTVAKAMVEQGQALHGRLVLVDNHYVNNPIFGLLDLDGIKPLPREVWTLVGKVNEAVMTTIRTLSPPEWSFIKTNYLADNASDRRGFLDVVDLAAVRGSALLPVTLRCDPEEHLRRIVDPRRAERLKWRDADGVRRTIEDNGYLDVEHPHLMDLDITGLAPHEAARLILERGQALLAGGG